MVMTSDQISALAGNFQAQNMGQMQHAAMISQQVGGQSFGQQAMGGAVNRGAAIGGGVATLGMGMAGLDPVSMGIRGAMAGGSRMGMMGAVGGGMMGAGMVAAPMMAAQYVGGQMMQGMNQQQQVGGALGQSFQFQNRHGGQGFTGGQQASIGQFLRTQSGQQGPGGEFQTMGELTRMTAMMGKMGMGGGVRDVKGFTEKFRSMMKEVKEIATAFNTTLEEAQQIMGSMRDSGISKNQGQIASQIRGLSLAGNLSTSEITSAMNVGSQISGAIGGRRGSGAMGGMKTIGQIGIAQTMGVLSDDDIFQQTGQRGAAGRAQMAQQSMSRSANFLKSGLGRRVLASMAGKDGMLDEESADEVGGGVGTGRTMGLAGKNLGKVGRANFIRNEGRLRGEVLGKFGGNADVMAMAGWLEGRGRDVNSDRERIFMQRRLGMSNDELDNAMKMYNKRDFMESQVSGATAQADQAKRIQLQQAGGGLKGIKKKFEAARNDVQNYLQQKGADFYSAGSNMLERWANQITGQFMTDMQENLEQEIRAVRQGGVQGRAIGAAKFGLGGGMGKTVQGLADSFQQDMMGSGGGMSNVQAFKQSGDLKRMRESGYRIKAGGSDAQLASSLRGMRGLQSAFQEGSEDDRYGELGGEMAGTLRRQAAVGNLSGRGTDFTASFTEMMGRQEGRAGQVGAQLSQASDKGRMKVAGSMMRGAGLGQFAAGQTGLPDQQSLFGTSKFRTAEDRNSAIGEYAMSGSGSKLRNDFLNQKVGGATRGKWIGTIGAALSFGQAGDWAKNKYESNVRGTEGIDKQEYGANLMSEGTQSRLRDMLSKDAGVAGDATEATENDMLKLQSIKKEDRSKAENTRLEVQRSMLVAQDFAKLAERIGPQAAAEQLAKGSLDKFGQKMTAEEVTKRGGSTLGSMGDTQKSARRQLFRRAREEGAGEAATYRQGGMYKGGQMTAGFSAELAEAAGGKAKTMSFEGDEAAQAAAAMGGVQRGGSSLDAKGGKFTATATGGQMYMGGMMRAAVLEEGITEGGGAENDARNRAKMEEAMKAREGARLGLKNMSNDEMRKVAASARKRGDLGSERALTQGVQLRHRMARAGGGLRGDMEIAKQMGSDIKGKDLRGMSEEGMAAAMGKDLLGSMAGTAAGKTFIEGKEGKGGLQEVIKLQRAGKGKEAADALNVLRGSSGGLIQKAAQGKQDEAAKKDDPSFRALEGIKKGIADLPSKLAAKPIQVVGLESKLEALISAVKES